MMTSRYKRLEIEWKHFTVGEVTCERGGNIGEAGLSRKLPSGHLG
jgi:hypothetical protein